MTFLTSRFDKELIGLRCVATQLKIAMRHTHCKAGGQEQVQHDHRVNAATHGQQDAVIGRAEPIANDFFLELLHHQTKITFPYFYTFNTI